MKAEVSRALEVAAGAPHGRVTPAEMSNALSVLADEVLATKDAKQDAAQTPVALLREALDHIANSPRVQDFALSAEQMQGIARDALAKLDAPTTPAPGSVPADPRFAAPNPISLLAAIDSALASLETIRTEKLAVAGLHAEAEAVGRARIILDGIECNCGGTVVHLLSCPLNPARAMLNKQHDAEREARTDAVVGDERNGRNEAAQPLMGQGQGKEGKP